ncbi:collagen alpha-1(III) chain isoform X4 [Phyllopteryx taeniolatus]|uniref:collagen alpha-1(III) chain isoform X4 n=1 Tax=Phyllopteryx taeniolatus TaxID=161469 RepID=UPI002AD4E30A|nr:collagen alpha-1(III) chain isoform X4 [Phyllopteryx taeniolatus]
MAGPHQGQEHSRHLGERGPPAGGRPMGAVGRRRADLRGSPGSREPRVLLPLPEGQSSSAGLRRHHGSEGWRVFVRPAEPDQNQPRARGGGGGGVRESEQAVTQPLHRHPGLHRQPEQDEGQRVDLPEEPLARGRRLRPGLLVLAAPPSSSSSSAAAVVLARRLLLLAAPQVSGAGLQEPQEVCAHGAAGGRQLGRVSERDGPGGGSDAAARREEASALQVGLGGSPLAAAFSPASPGSRALPGGHQDHRQLPRRRDQRPPGPPPPRLPPAAEARPPSRRGRLLPAESRRRGASEGSRLAGFLPAGGGRGELQPGVALGEGLRGAEGPRGIQRVPPAAQQASRPPQEAPPSPSALPALAFLLVFLLHLFGLVLLRLVIRRGRRRRGGDAGRRVGGAVRGPPLPAAPAGPGPVDPVRRVRRLVPHRLSPRGPQKAAEGPQRRFPLRPLLRCTARAYSKSRRTADFLLLPCGSPATRVGF